MKMRWTRWIWYAGAGAWTLDGLLSLHVHHGLQARIELTIAILFGGAGYFFQGQKN